MSTQVTFTADELLAMPPDGMRHELVRGELRTMPPAGYEHGRRGMSLTWRVAQHVEKHNLGGVTMAETGYLLQRDPDTVRAPDIGFVRSPRCDSGPDAGFFPGPPDLAVEVVSPNDSHNEVEEKVAEWLLAGAVEVWIVHPQRRTITVRSGPNTIRILNVGDTLESPELLPGFRFPLAELFD